MEINNSKFINNTGGSRGGALAQNGGNLTIENSIFNNNTATFGPAIGDYSGDCYVNNCNFTNNSGTYGGAISSRDKISVNNSNFINNIGELGGAAYLYGNNAVINNSNLYGNDGTSGGAIRWIGDNGIIENSNIKNNTAKNFFAGGIYWSGHNGTLINVTIQDNIAEEMAAGILYFDDNLKIINSTINNNKPSENETMDALNIPRFVYTTITGYSNVTLSNNYSAYCTDSRIEQPTKGTFYITQDSTNIINRLTGENVEDYIKIYIVKHYENILNNVSKVITFRTPVQITRDIIWIFTNNDFKNYNFSNIPKFQSTTYSKFLNDTIRSILEDYDNGLRFGDKTFIKLNDTHVRTYNFLAHDSIEKVLQPLFSFRITEEEIYHDLTIYKESLNKTVTLGNQTSFLIIAKNTGNDPLSNVQIIEDSYEGLIYDSFIDSTNSWMKSINEDGKHVWTLNYNLDPGHSVNFTVIFNTTKIGNFTNIIVGDSNETNETPANNTTTVEEPEPPEPHSEDPPKKPSEEPPEKPSEEQPKTPSEEPPEEYKNTIDSITSTKAGNPLSVLLIVILMLNIVLVRGKK